MAPVTLAPLRTAATADCVSGTRSRAEPLWSTEAYSSASSARHGAVVEHWGNVRRDLRAAVRRANAQLATEMAKRGGTFEPIPFVSPNDLRRTFASWLAQNGKPCDFRGAQGRN